MSNLPGRVFASLEIMQIASIDNSRNYDIDEGDCPKTSPDPLISSSLLRASQRVILEYITGENFFTDDVLVSSDRKDDGEAGASVPIKS